MGGKSSKEKNKEIEDVKNMYVKYEVDKPQITISNKRYEIVEKIGQGGFGVVYKALYNGKAFAIKQMKIDASNAESVLKELAFLAAISSGADSGSLPVIRLFGMEKIDSSVFIVMELALCDLQDFVDISKSKEKIIKFLNFVLMEDSSHPCEFNIKLIDFSTINT